MDDSPLHILGLSADEVTVPLVKTAYARLLKVFRPDADPEGFKRLRTAYEAALAMAQTGAEPVPQNLPSETTAHSQSAPSPQLSDSLRSALEALSEAVKSRARQRLRDAWARFDAEAASLGLKERFHLAMSAFDKAPIVLLADVCTDERLLAHVGEGEVQLVHAALKGWTDQRDVRRMREFVASLNRARTLHPLPECAMVMIWTAVALAAWEPETASRLAHKAYPALPPEQRTELVQRAEWEVQLGRLVTALPETERLFWLACLHGRPPSDSWGDPEGRRLLSNLLRLCGPKWEGFGILARAMPEDPWKRLVAAINLLAR